MIRKKISAKLKAQIALEAIKGNETIDSFSQRFGVHPTQIKKWKSELLAHSEKVFSKENKNSVKFIVTPFVKTLFSQNLGVKSSSCAPRFL